jgi:hypothetical protein
MNDWLKMFGLDVDKFMGSSYTTRSHHTPNPGPKANPHFSMSVGLMNQQRVSEDNLRRPNLLMAPNSLSLMTPNLNSRLATRSSSFGLGMLLTDLNDRAIVTILDGSQGDVVQSVLASVLNASTILEVSYGGKEEYYFLKESGFSTDLGELQRLSGTYNISSESGIRNNAGAKVLCAQNRASAICIMYEVEKRLANRWALKKAHKEAVASAWRKEAVAVKQGLNGLNQEWSPSQRAELNSNGDVRGFAGIEMSNVHKFPQLIGQSSNIRFVPETEARSWHSSLRKRKKYGGSNNRD